MYKKVLKSIKELSALKNEVLAGLYKNEENSVMARKPHFIFSAENPMYPENHVYNMKHDEVLNMLKQKGYNAESVSGHYGKPERSILVHNPPKHSLDHLLDLSKKLGQESSIYSDGYNHEMHFHGGPNADHHVKGQGTTIHKRKPDDHFTEMKDGKSFTHLFNFDELHPPESSITKDPQLSTKKSEVDFVKSEPNHPLIGAGPDTKLIHFSTTPGLKNIDPAHQGARIKDSSSKYGKPEHPVSFFYLEGAKPEGIVTSGASSKYVARLGHHKVYDLGTDPENIRHGLREASKDRQVNPGSFTRDELDAAIKAKGYHGIYNSAHPVEDHRMVVGMYHRMPVEKETKFHPKDAELATDQAYEQHHSLNKSVRRSFDEIVKSAESPQQSPQEPKHNEQVRQVADQYAQSKGLKLNHNIPPAKVDPQNAKKIADAYHGAKHEPQNPHVQQAYKALIGETNDQFKHMLANGLQVSKIQPGAPNPYKSSKDLFHDIKNNNHIAYFPTDQGFGSGDQASDHPMLQPTEHMHEGKPMLANDVFRIVHDYFGHAKEGNGFGPNGEEGAWQHHMQMYSPLAQKALTAETRGQNSWVNFGPHGEANRKNPGNTVYADQKATILPDHASQHGEQSIYAKLGKSEIDVMKSVGTDEDANPLMNRVEDKYFLKADRLNDVISLLKLQLPNGDIDTSTRYSINSTIYLDNRDLDSFQDNLMSVKPRFKVRIRRYNPNGEGWEDVAYVELKIKEKDGMTRKLRIRIPERLIEPVSNGESITVNNELIDLNRDLEKTVVWKRTALINSVIIKYGFKKQLVVEYNRRAYSSGNIRITIDDSLKYHSFQPIERDVMGYITNSDNWKSSIKPVKRLMSNDLLIMEVKHEEETPKWIKSMLKSSKAKEVHFSKYCAAIATFIMSNGNTEGRVQQQKKVGAYEILDILHSSPEIMEKTEVVHPSLSGKHSERLDILMKGAMKRVAPYNPDKHISAEDHKATENWTSEGDDQEARSKVPEMHANAKVRALHKLGAHTEVRRHPKTGERMFLLHRGMDPNEHAQNQAGGLSNYAPGTMTSWTPHYAVAKNFSGDHAIPGQKPKIASAWVPESEIHNIPNQTMIPDENSQFRNEYEVIVNHRTPHPHANKELVVKARNPRLFLDNKINIKGQVEAAMKDPTTPEQMMDKQVKRTVRAEEYKRTKFGKREAIIAKPLTKNDVASKIKNGVAGLAMAAATMAPMNAPSQPSLDQAPKIEQVQTQAPVNQRKQRILSSIMDVESSGGKNTNHKALPKAGIHQGEKAYGSYGLMPLTIRETIKSNPSFKQHAMASKLMGDKLHAYMNKNPGLEKQIAEAHYDRLAKQFGDNPDKIGYAWLNGIHGTWQALKEKRPLNQHQYVKKILNAYALHKKAVK